jgi:TolB-like protein/Tfp pilus assembly protein PilF
MLPAVSTENRSDFGTCFAFQADTRPLAPSKRQHDVQNHLVNPHTEEIETPAKRELGMGEQSPDRASSSDFNHKNKRILIWVVLGAAALALGFGFWSLWHRLAPEITAPASLESTYVASFPEKSIAVLPFQDLSETKENVFLADGVQDDILTALSKVADLKVISRTSANAYAPNNPRNLREIAQSLGVAFLLEGSVRLAGEKVQIIAQLTDARRGARLWDQSYERDLTDLLGMQSEIVQRIASQLQAVISSKEKAAIEERPTKDLLAYGLYVRAKDLMASLSFTAQINEKLTQAIELLHQSIARDPDFYLAYCQLAAAHNYLYFFGLDHTTGRLASAEAALRTVIRLRPDTGETHLAKANFFYRCHLDYDKARAELALAQRTLPNNSQIFELTGYIDRRQGLWDESARSLQRAFGLDPGNVFLLQQIAISYQEFRQFRAMAAALDRALSLSPRDLDTRVTRALLELEWRADTRPLHRMIDRLVAENPTVSGDLADQWLYLSLCERDPATASRALAAIPRDGIATDLNFPHAWCEALVARAKGDAAAAHNAFLAARAEAKKTVSEQPDYGPAYMVLGLTDAGLGRKEEAIREGRRGIELLPVSKDSMDGAELMKYLGVIYAWTGEIDLAIQQVAATLKIPSTLSYGNLKLHPNWDALRGDPRFEKMVADLAPKTPEK